MNEDPKLLSSDLLCQHPVASDFEQVRFDSMALGSEPNLPCLNFYFLYSCSDMRSQSQTCLSTDCDAVSRMKI
jgi:hypothetical protein